MRIVFFLVRIALFVVFFHLIYVFYKSLQKHPKEKAKKKTPMMNICPSPKVFIDYTEGRIKGKQKQHIDKHIANCKNCQDALKDVFDMPRKPGY